MRVTNRIDMHPEGCRCGPGCDHPCCFRIGEIEEPCRDRSHGSCAPLARSPRGRALIDVHAEVVVARAPGRAPGGSDQPLGDRAGRPAPDRGPGS